MKCGDCGHKNREGILICENCGSDIYDILVGEAETKELEEGREKELGLAEPATSRPIILYVADGSTPISIKRQNNLIMGKSSKDTQINLSPFKAEEHGVSRQHARLDAAESPPALVDLSSSNGTYINGERLEADVRWKLESGDEIQLGRLKMRIYFK